jgi:hypothetical protein
MTKVSLLRLLNIFLNSLDAPSFFKQSTTLRDCTRLESSGVSLFNTGVLFEESGRMLLYKGIL